MRKVRHQQYKDIVFTEGRSIANMKSLRSVHQSIYTIELNKVGLCAYDTKRYLLDGTLTLAHGHYETLN